MNEFEDKLRKAMDSPGGYEAWKEETLREALTGGFRGWSRLLTGLAWAYTVLFIALAILCAVLFFRSSSERDHVLYAALFVVVNFDLVLAKVWFWQRWTRNSILRELKRLEMRVLERLSEPRK
jgi:hypothetical protein